MIKFKCKKCGEQLEAPESMKGEELICPQCGDKHIIPVASPREPKNLCLSSVMATKINSTANEILMIISGSVLSGIGTLIIYKAIFSYFIADTIFQQQVASLNMIFGCMLGLCAINICLLYCFVSNSKKILTYIQKK